MKKIKIETTAILSVLALGLAIPAFAQNATTLQSEPAADPGPGLVGTNYSEVSFAYLKQGGAPKSLRNYEFLSNGAVFKKGNLGVDANFRYDYLTAGSSGFRDRRSEVQLGLTGFMMESWGKPFVTADAGYAWQNAGGVSRRSVAYTLTGGVEFQVLKDLALTPFGEFQSEPHLYNNQLPLTNFPNHVFYYGVKATYRITRLWSASLSATLDQHSTNDFGLRAGISYRF